MRRKQKGPEFWAEIVAGAETSGLTRARYAEKMGVGRAALSYWLAKLRGGDSQKRKKFSTSLVPVRVVEDRTPHSPALTLECADLMLRFSEGTSVEYIAQLASAFRRC